MYDFDPDAEAVKSLVGLSIAEVERDLILQTLCQTLGNRTHAAGVLGISIRTMRNKLSAYEAEGVEVTPSSTVYNALEQDAIHAQTTKPNLKRQPD